MAQVLIRLGVGCILALAIMLAYQLWRMLPRTWGTARIGRIVYLSLWGVGAWIILWLGTALALAFAREWWAFVPPRWAVNAINALLILSLLALLAVCNWSVYRWRREGRH